VRNFVSALIVATAASNAFAQDSGVRVYGDFGNEISLSSVEVYRTLGDRIVSGMDATGNNARRWNQVDPRLPASLIADFDPQGLSADAILRAIREGCDAATGRSSVCQRVGIRRDLTFVDHAAVTPSIPQTYVASTVVAGSGGATTSIVTTELPAATPPPPPPPPSPPPAPVAPEPEPARVEVVPAMAMAVTEPEPMVEMISDAIVATRHFAKRADFPPQKFAGYGIVAFKSLATPGDRDRHIHICHAFFASLIDSGSSGTAVDKQMVTIWPIIDDYDDDALDGLNTQALQDGMCDDAVQNYDLVMANVALRQAERAGGDISGAGPFLLAWAPGETKGRTDTVVLIADFSDVESEDDAKEAMQIWKDDIEGDQELWNKGFTLVKLRAKMRRMVDKYGESLLKFIKAG